MEGCLGAKLGDTGTAVFSERSNFARWIVLFVVALAYPVVCSNYYFDAESGSDGNVGSRSSPWKSLGKFRQLNPAPGDSILLKRGSNWTKDSIIIRVTGAIGKPVVFSDYGESSKSRPHIASAGLLIVVDKSKYVVIENLELSGARGGCVEMWDSSSAHIVVQGVEAHGCGGGIYATGTDVVLRDNFLHDGKMVVNTKDVMDDDYGATGINLGRLDGCDVHGNRLVDLVAPSFDYGVDGGAIEFWKTTRNCDIHGNFAYRTDGFMEFGGQAGDSVVGVAIHHNVALETSVLACFHVASSTNPFGVGYENVRVDNNLVVKRKSAPWTFFLIADGAALDRIDRIKVRNNIFVADSATMLSYQPSGMNPGFEHSYNLFWTPGFDPFKNGLKAGAGEMLLEPMFVGEAWNAMNAIDTVVSDFALDSASPAVASGVDLHYATDYFGNAASRGRATDRGPLALGSVSNSVRSMEFGRMVIPVVADRRGGEGAIRFNLDLPWRMVITARLVAVDGTFIESWGSWIAEAGASTRSLPISVLTGGVHYLVLESEDGNTMPPLPRSRVLR